MPRRKPTLPDKLPPQIPFKKPPKLKKKIVEGPKTKAEIIYKLNLKQNPKSSAKRKRFTVGKHTNGGKRSENVPKITKLFKNVKKSEIDTWKKTQLSARVKRFLLKYLLEDFDLDLEDIEKIDNYFDFESQTFFYFCKVWDAYFILRTKITYSPGYFNSSVLQMAMFT
ncbi:MAG: hypothetical protein ACRC6U_08420, partial [Fusobacteriaceae bacterium]